VSTDGDLKVGVPLRKGVLPPSDECSCLFRAEVKNHKASPKKLFALVSELEPIFYHVDEKVKVKGLIGSALKQREGIHIALIRDPNPPAGAIKNLEPNMFAAVIRMDALIKLLRGYLKHKALLKKYKALLVECEDLRQKNGKTK